MKNKEAYKILTNQDTIIIDYETGKVNKQWKEAYDIAVNNLITTKKLVQTNKSYKGILQKQSKTINAIKTICKQKYYDEQVESIAKSILSMLEEL